MRTKSISIFLAAMLYFSTYLYSAEVNVKTAGNAATNFFYEQVASERGIGYENILILDHYTASTNGLADYHVFNFAQGGWVVVAADDVVKPILAYGKEGYFMPKQGAPATKAWMNQYAQSVNWYRQQGAADISITNLWNHYLMSSPSSLGRPDNRGDVAPFMNSHWGQGKYYNAMCPDDVAGEDGHALVGCVATSMSQVMYYYRHPQQGTGSHGYYANNSGSGYGDYGFLSVNFSTATYDWEGMSDQISGTNANLAAAELCYHAGVAVDMAYGPNASGSQTQYAAAALKTYFGFTPSVLFLQRYMYTASQWDATLRNNLNGKKPVIYAGTQVAGSGHAWIFDGYDTTNQGTFFHCNWGWDGMSDGYFSIDDLAPGSEPPFSAYQSAIVNIYPAGTYPPNCSSTKNVTMRTGTITDQSGPATYASNLDCYWLLHPTDSINNLYMSFDRFDVADDNDVVTIYDGPTTAAPVLGTFNASNAPSGSFSSTGTSVLIHFETDGSGEAEGWQIAFQGTKPDFCGNEVLTEETGTVSDGSGSADYSTNSTCSWRIEPAGGIDLTLHFTSFDVGEGDFINVYDWGSQTLLLNKYTGSTPPADITAPSGSVYIEFKSDWNTNGAGWEASYTVANVGIEETAIKDLNIYPNPASDRLTISMYLNGTQNVDLAILDMTGRVVLTKELSQASGAMETSLDVSQLPKGLYFLKAESDQGIVTRKVTVK